MRQTDNTVFEVLKDYLVQNYGAKVASGGKEIVKRCHKCGDSRNLSDAHMYIGTKDGVILYNCFKCGAKGIVDYTFFREIGSFDANLISMVNDQNKSAFKSLNKISYTAPRFFRPNLTISDCPYNYNKLQYINDRMGLNLSFNDVTRLGIVLNIKDFLYFNRINYITRAEAVIDEMEKYYIGFLSVDKNFIMMRRIVDEGIVKPFCDERHINYNIWGSYEDNRRYYIIPTVINTLQPVKIHIAEGAFDALGIYFNTNSDKTNSIFASCGGKVYEALMRYFIMDMGLINFEVHLYPDNDVNDYKIQRVINNLSVYKSDIYVHRNLCPGENDFGVSKNKIMESIIKC